MRRSKAPSNSSSCKGNPTRESMFSAGTTCSGSSDRTNLSGLSSKARFLNSQFKRPLREDQRTTRGIGSQEVRVVRRVGFLPFLRVPASKQHVIEERINKPFKTPCRYEYINMLCFLLLISKSVLRPGVRTKESDALLKRKRLGCLPGKFLLKHGGKFRKPSILSCEGIDGSAFDEENTVSKVSIATSLMLKPTKNEENNSRLNSLPPYDPLVLWRADETETSDVSEIIVPEILGRFLRPHQREGVKFLFDCVTGLNEDRKFDGRGCILADDMGLGKTLQSITLLYTLLVCGFRKNDPIAKKVIVVCPTSLVRNWENEISKWLETRVRVVAISESVKKEVIKQVKAYCNTNLYQCLIISYDTFRLHSKLFTSESSCDLLICDEAHRLKNDQTLTSKALDSLACRRRVLLSGTPLQNDLEEFFSMVNFCNPGILGTVSQFRKHYQNPILIGREPDASDSEVAKSEECTQKLSDIVNLFILRRTNTLNVKYLPPKLTLVVCVKLSPFQKQLYEHMMQAKQFLADGGEQNKGVTAMALSSINGLKKLCNHAQLVYKPRNLYGKVTENKNGAATEWKQLIVFFRMALPLKAVDDHDKGFHCILQILYSQ